MADTREFAPDWASPPGETITDLLRSRRMSAAELSQQAGADANEIVRIIAGQSRVTVGLASTLSRIVGASPEFWLARDRRYWEATHRLQSSWLDELPIDDMLRFGWLPANSSGSADEVLKFFGVPSIRAWRSSYSALLQSVQFRNSPSFDSHPGAVAAWLRQGEVEAQAIQCDPWNRDAFVNSLQHIRVLSRLRDPNHFFPKLRAICAAAGVAVVVVRAPDGCRASGAARFVSESLAVIQLSFRYLTDDHFWFTFFHEAGHIVLHGSSGLYLEELGTREPADEVEASRFAVDQLIPSELQAEFKSLRANTRDVLRFASKAGIAAGIVVGQMQHAGLIPQTHLNRLKRRYQWESVISIQPRKGT